MAFGDTVTTTDLSYTWTEDKTDGNGDDYIYTVAEPTVPDNYASVVSAPVTDEAGNVTVGIRNTYTSPKITITATKTWVNGPITDEEVTLQLLRNGIPYGSSVTPNALSFNWTADKKDGSGAVYEYTVAEPTVPDNYASVVGTRSVEGGGGNVSVGVRTTCSCP